MSKKMLMLTAVVLVFSACQVQAVVTWDGGDPCNLWHAAANWNPDGVPDPCDDVVINMGTEEDEEEIQLPQSDFTINTLDISGDVELGAFGAHWLGITITNANGLTNNGNLEIWTDGWIGLNANVTNTAGARLELERIDIEGDFTNDPCARVEIWDEVEITGDVDNYGTIEVDAFSEMWVEDMFTLNNEGLIQLHGGISGSEGTLDNDTDGIIKGFGAIDSEMLLINSGKIIAEGGVLNLYSNSLENTATGVLSNEFVSSLQIDAEWDVENYGTINVNAGGGVAFDCNLVNESGGIIKLRGGTLAAQNITQSAGATFEGGGTIACRNLLIESSAEIELNGPMIIVGDVNIVSGGTLMIRASQTFIGGHTTNDGTIVLAGGTVLFQGGYSGSGEVSVPPADNVALSKAASQSSIAFGGVPSRAIDGNTDGDWAQYSVTCTNNELNSWWQVDLGTTYDVSAIEVWNRTGSSCVDRLDDFYVFVSDTPFSSTDLTATLNESGIWSRHVTVVPDPQFLFPVGRTGRYVRIQLGDTNYLSLAEVKVFGEVSAPLADNVALNKTASQSSTVYGGVPGRAIDDNTNGEWAQQSVTCTDEELNSWWQVDLGATYDVSTIEVWNRTGSSCVDRLDDFYVFVSDTPFSSTDLTATLNEDGVWSRHVTAVPDPQFPFPVGRTGRYVRIQLGDTNYLSLAEVKVFGKVFVP